MAISNNFQNTTMNPDTDFIPDQYSDMQQYQSPYMNGSEPTPMPGNNTEDTLYPFESTFNNSFNNPYPSTGYKRGGKVKSQKKQQDKPYHVLAEMIRRQGNNEDSILAHINPLEAMLLESIGGSGEINPKTGLPQYSFWSNPGKALKAKAGAGLGAVLGNMVLPGIGGIIGGALGGGIQNSARGKNFGQGALSGAGLGLGLPTVSSLVGSGLGSLGSQALGNSLSNYGSQNAIMSSLGNIIGGSKSSSLGSLLSAGNTSTPAAGVSANLANQGGSEIINNGIAEQAGQAGFLNKLMGNTSDFLSQPQNLLTTGVLASSFLNRPKKQKEKSLAEQEADLLAKAQMYRRIERNKYLPEERLKIDPLYVKTNTPEEYKNQKKWLNYYDNPQFTGNPIMMKGGGMLKHMMLDEDIEPVYIDGLSGGQDDDIRMDLPENSYIVNASTVSDLGDGNSRAGAEKIRALVSSGEVRIPPKAVQKLGKGDIKAGSALLDKMVKNVAKHKRGGKINLPPKAKPITKYIRG